MTAKRLVHLTVNLPTSDAEALTGTAELLGTNRTTVLVKAIRMSQLIEEAMSAGSSIQIIHPGGETRELHYGKNP